MALGRRAVKEEHSDKSIEINAQMQGSLSFNDPVNLKINGEFTGSLSAKGTLTIGNNGIVNANISGDNIVIAGRVNGDIARAVEMCRAVPSRNGDPVMDQQTILILIPSCTIQGVACPRHVASHCVLVGLRIIRAG